MPNPIAHILAHHPFVVLDGALATQLERRGCDLRDPLWSARVLLEQSELIGAVQRDYLVAGADCVTTATYQATFEGLARRGLDHSAARALLRQAMQLAVDVRDNFWSEADHRVGRPRPIVVASIGPYGAFLADGSEYRGDYTLDEAALMDFHGPRLATLIEAGAECVACETIPNSTEARALARLLLDFPDASAWISFSARDGTQVVNGEPIDEAAASLSGFPQVVAMGVNCTAPQHIPSLVRTLVQATALPVVVYPNSGETYDGNAHAWGGAAADLAMGEDARVWYAAGARLIGGCCRTTPDDIRMVAALRAEQSGKRLLS